MDLAPLFAPRHVAVIGASHTPGKIGHTVVANMRKAGFPGPIYPVNPKGGEIEGLTVVSAISELPGPLDLGVIAVPRRLVLDALRELAQVPTAAVIVITAGFKEVGKQGYHLEEELVAVAREHDMALLGPNCLGLMNTHAHVNASFSISQPLPGEIAFFSQSGALCLAILDWANGEGIGFSKFISLGNKAVLDETHMLDHLGQDPETRVILGYVENIDAGREFMAQATRVTHTKPVIMLKSGTTAAGSRAASSHTGAIAGSEQAYAAAFRQSGVIRVDTVQRLFTLAEAFAGQELPAGPNLAVVTNSGGPGILAADAAERAGLTMVRMEGRTVEALAKVLPPYAALYNPVDIIGDANAGRYRDALEVVAADERVHALLVMLTPTAQVEIEETARAIVDVAKSSGKPTFACFMGRERVDPGVRILQAASIPCYDFPEPAVDAIGTMVAQSRWRQRHTSDGMKIERDVDRARRHIEEARRWGVRELVEFQAQEILAAYNLPVPATRLARSSDEAARIAAEFGMPVVLKIASAQISHKSDVGGVQVGLESEDEVRAAFLELTSRAQRLRPEAYITGCLVQAQAPKGSREVIVGFSRDDQFGPLLMFGLGGIYVEVLKDIAFRLAPLTLNDAREMVREIKSYMLLKGFRGEPPVDFAAIHRVILTMSALAMDLPEVSEAEFNPVLVSEHGALVADVRLTLSA